MTDDQPLRHPLKILLTGATGFVGRAVLQALHRRGIDVRVAVRRPVTMDGVDTVAVGPVEAVADWRPVLTGVDAVIHLAALVHVMDAGAGDGAAFMAVNADATARLAQAAAEAGVGRFVFLSSVKAQSERSDGAPLTEAAQCRPEDAYGRSKRRAEELLGDIAERTGLSVAILRPPLVFGPGVGANFLSLMGLVDRALPLPFGGVENQRSLIFVDNLADAVVTAALGRPAGTWLVADRPALSTPDLVRRLARALDRPPRLFSVPKALIRLGAAAPGIGPRLSRLTGDLAVDDSAFRRDFGWQPPVTMDQAFALTAAWFRARTRQ